MLPVCPIVACTGIAKDITMGSKECADFALPNGVNSHRIGIDQDSSRNIPSRIAFVTVGINTSPNKSFLHYYLEFFLLWVYRSSEYPYENRKGGKLLM